MKQCVSTALVVRKSACRRSGQQHTEPGCTLQDTDVHLEERAGDLIDHYDKQEIYKYPRAHGHADVLRVVRRFPAAGCRILVSGQPL